MKKFEYKGVSIKNLGDIEEFNNVGSEGWELVSVLPGYGNGYKGIFKREIDDTDKIVLND